MFAPLVLALTIGSTGEVPPQRPVRDGERSPAATATIRGRVTDRENGQPLPRFRVSVSKQPVVDDTSPTIATATTGANGEYELTAVPAGAYLITARPPPFVSTHLAQAYGDDDPLAMSGTRRIRLAELKPNASFEAHFALRRSLAIEGRIATADGDPLAGVLVSLERLDRRASREPLETDDRGFYRHFGLPPGRYRLCVAPAPPGALGGVSQAAARDLVTTCYPAESDPAHPDAIVLAGADVGSADLVMKSARRLTVNGELRDSGGGPLDAGELSFVEENARPRRSLPVQRMGSGRFAIERVEPGTYALRIDVAGDAASGRPREYASMQVVVQNEDVGGIVLRARRSEAVAGVLTFEGDAPKTATGMAVAVMKDPGSSGETSALFASRPVRENLTFDLPAMSEPARLGLNHTPPGWIVKSILHHGRDVTDEPVVLESSGGARALEIVLTNRVVFITGTAAAVHRTRPIVVLAFRADKIGIGERPDASGGSSLPVSASALADEKGAFTVGPLAPGEYLVAAADRDEWFDASVENRSAAVGRVLTGAERVMVREGQQPSVSLRTMAVK